MTFTVLTLHIIVVREDLLNHANPMCPVILDYKQVADLDSVYNTPCTIAVYVLGLVLDWIIAQGGVKGMFNLLTWMLLLMVLIYSNGE